MTRDSRIDFFIVKKCVNKCIFCSERSKIDNSELSLDEIRKTLIAEKKKGARLVHFVGGEPTLHGKFTDILKMAKNLNYNIFIITNVIKFSSREFCEKNLPYLNEIMVSVHGYNRKTHAANTGNSDSFPLLIKGLANLGKYFKGRLEATSAITVYNYKHLKKIAELINSFGIKEYQCMSIVPEGEGDKNFLKIVPSYTKLKSELERVIRYCEENNIKVRFSGIPMCLLGDKYIYSHDLWEPFKINNEEAGKIGKKNIDLWREPGETSNNFEIDIGRIKTKKCGLCRKKSICGGIYQKYFQHYGDVELKPHKN